LSANRSQTLKFERQIKRVAFFDPMKRLSGPQSLVKTISLLGGPLLKSNDIDWATDLPAGNAFFGWLADQLHDWSPNLELQDVTSGNVDDVEDGKTLEIRMYAALREMALEKDEVLVFVSGFTHSSSLQITVLNIIID
jgi:hypothetical protein